MSMTLVMDQASSTHQPDVTQAYFGLFHAANPETGDTHYLLLKGKKEDGQLRILGGEAEGNETAKAVIIRETAEEMGIIEQDGHTVINPVLYGLIHDVVDTAFASDKAQFVYSKRHELTEAQVARGWHPSHNNVYAIECDFADLQRLFAGTEHQVTVEGIGTSLVSKTDLQENGFRDLRHPYEQRSIELHATGSTELEIEFEH